MDTTVVHLKRKKSVEVVSCDVYIGRPMFQGGWRLPGSVWANPYRLSDYDQDRQRVLDAYEAHVRSSPELMARLPELRGKRLGCWCVEPRCLTCCEKRGSCGHLQCHGEVLVKLLQEVSAPADIAPTNEVSAGVAAETIRDDDPIWLELGL